MVCVSVKRRALDVVLFQNRLLALPAESKVKLLTIKQFARIIRSEDLRSKVELIVPPFSLFDASKWTSCFLSLPLPVPLATPLLLVLTVIRPHQLTCSES